MKLSCSRSGSPALPDFLFLRGQERQTPGSHVEKRPAKRESSDFRRQPWNWDCPPGHPMEPRSCVLSTIPWGKRPHGAGRTLEPNSSNQIFRVFQPKNAATKMFQLGIFLPTGLDQNPNLTENRGDIRFISTVFSPTRGLQ